MLSGLSAGRIWLCTQPTDMRCSFDGLSARVRRYLGEDPTSGQWFVFINRRWNRATWCIPPVKILVTRLPYHLDNYSHFSGGV